MLTCLHRNILCMAVMLVYRAWLYFSPFISKLPSRMVFFLKKNPKNNASFDNKWRKKITTLPFRLSKILVNPLVPFQKIGDPPPKKIPSLLVYILFFFFFANPCTRATSAEVASRLQMRFKPANVPSREDRRGETAFFAGINALPGISLGPDFAVGEKAKNGVRRLWDS